MPAKKKGKKKDDRERYYAMVWNNYPDDWRKFFDKIAEMKNTRFLVGGKEIGKLKGTPHIQGHIDLKNGTTMKALQKHFRKFGIKKGENGLTLREYEDAKHCYNGRNYCYKDGDFTEWGTKPIGQGARTDLLDCMQEIKDEPNMTRLELFEKHPSVMARYGRFADEYKAMVHRPKSLDYDDAHTPHLWIWGNSGIGKTRQFWDATDEGKITIYVKNCDNWWCGYNGEHTVLIDDPRIEQIHKCCRELTQWAQQYPFRAPIKGSSLQIRPPRIVITANYSIEDCSLDEQTTTVLQRRFKQIHMTADMYPIPEVTSLY